MDIQEKYLEKLKNGLGQLEISYTEEMIAAFFHYYEMIIEKNKVMNLTAITELDEVIEKHFLDSVSLARSMELHKKMRMLDIGTGAGFPGIPLKILFPELDILLMDSLNKRVRFLDEVIHQLGLDGIAAVHGRAEDMAQKSEYREQFHLCVSRAVANLASLCGYGLGVCFTFSMITKERESSVPVIMNFSILTIFPPSTEIAFLACVTSFSTSPDL